MGIYFERLQKSVGYQWSELPLPIIRAKNALDKLKSGDELTVISTDPASPKDFEAFAEQHGHVLLETSEDDGGFCYRLKKA